MKTLENWFLPKNEFCIEKTYFYLEWNYNAARPKKVEWLSSLPTNCNLIKKITLNGCLQITVCGKVYNETSDPFTDLESSFEYKNKSLLKSHLQKCVRRKLECKAIRTAYFHMKRDIGDFVRRLPIIMLEDTCLHDSIQIIVWFMCMNDKINYQNYMIWFFMGIVHYISTSDYCDGTEIKRQYTSKPDIINLWNETEKLPEKIRNMIFSLIIRYSFGGMKGDGNMIIDNIYYYLQNPNYKSRFSDKIRPVKIYKSLYLNEFEKSAIDFHCYPMIISDLADLYPDINPEMLKKTIWFNSSCFNKRKPFVVEEEYLQIWNMIKNDYDRIAQDLLVSYI